MDLSKWLHLLDIVTLMNTCIQATLDETLMTLMGMVSNFFLFLYYYYRVILHGISSVNNYTIFMLGAPLRIFSF